MRKARKVNVFTLSCISIVQKLNLLAYVALYPNIAINKGFCHQSPKRGRLKNLDLPLCVNGVLVINDKT